MSALRRNLLGIWQDIRHGKDIELYLTVPIAVTVITANVLGRTSPGLISSVTLALLTLLVVALLKMRKQTEQLESALRRADQPTDRFFRMEHEIGEVTDLILSSKSEIWLWGTTLSMHIPPLLPYLEQAVAQGMKIRILLISGEPGTAMSLAAFRAGHSTTDELQDELATSLSKLERTAARLAASGSGEQSGRFQVRTLDYLAPYLLYAFDPALPSGRVHIRLSSLRTPHDARPTFTLRTGQSERWYAHLLQQFETAWAAGAEKIDTSPG